MVDPAPSSPRSVDWRRAPGLVGWIAIGLGLVGGALWGASFLAGEFHREWLIGGGVLCTMLALNILAIRALWRRIVSIFATNRSKSPSPRS